MTNIYSSVMGEFTFFGASVVAGVFLAVLYDIIRISRRLVKVGSPVVLSEDIIFFVLSAVTFFGVAYITNDGEVRVHGFLGAAFGITVYFSLVKNRFVNIGTALITWLIKASLKVLTWLWLPMKMVLRAIKKPVDVVVWYTGKKIMGARRRAATAKARFGMQKRAFASMIRKK